MFLRSVSLRDWKAFESQRFVFPKPEPDRNVVLIGGRNGYGKTTLFEAIALGLFGAEGIRLVARATAAVEEPTRRRAYYDFLKTAFNGRALAQGRTSCRIELEFEDARGEPIIIERLWHFATNGDPKAGEDGEQIYIRKGMARTPIGPPTDEPDREGWFRDWIARTFLPVTQAAFFLFDGEAASAYAERDMGVQVREGIEGLLGLDWLRQLGKNLRDYAKQRGVQVPSDATTEALKALEHQIEEIEQRLAADQERLVAVARELVDAEARRDSAARELAGYGTGTVARLGEFIKLRSEQEKTFEAAQAELFRLAERDLPLAMVGEGLLGRVRERLERERRREQWEAAVAETKARVAHILQELRDELAAVSPPLLPEQTNAVTEGLARGLERLWHPPPNDAAEDIRHTHLLGRREDVLQRLAEAGTVVSSRIAQLLNAMTDAASQIQRLDAAIRQTEVTAPQLDEKKAALAALIRQVDSLREEKVKLENALSSEQAELEQMRKDLARRRAKVDQSAKPARLARRAEEIAVMLDDLLGDAWLLQRTQVAAAMTEAIRAMVHRKDLLNRVEISETGELRLLSQDGTNLRDFQLSAGEKQIFTQALFAAVAKVAGRQFPLIIDTPLGRLDEEHRHKVLSYLANRPGQVILISTDTEVVGPYLETIRHRVQKAYRLENRVDGKFGTSWAVEGYFPGQGLDA